MTRQAAVGRGRQRGPHRHRGGGRSGGRSRSGPVVAASDGDDSGDDQQQRKNHAPHEPAGHRSPLSVVVLRTPPDAPVRGPKPAPDLPRTASPLEDEDRGTRPAVVSAPAGSSVAVTL